MQTLSFRKQEKTWCEKKQGDSGETDRGACEQRESENKGRLGNGAQVEVPCVLNPRPLPSEEARRLREHRQRQTRWIGSTWQRGSGEQVTKIEKSLLNSSLLCDVNVWFVSTNAFCNSTAKVSILPKFWSIHSAATLGRYSTLETWQKEKLAARSGGHVNNFFENVHIYPRNSSSLFMSLEAGVWVLKFSSCFESLSPVSRELVSTSLYCAVHSLQCRMQAGCL